MPLMHCVVWFFRGARNLEELNGILREHLLIRRLKKDVLHELPLMQRHRRTILPDAQLLPVRPPHNHAWPRKPVRRHKNSVVVFAEIAVISCLLLS